MKCTIDSTALPNFAPIQTAPKTLDCARMRILHGGGAMVPPVERRRAQTPFRWLDG
jgi:hypothetical protein